MFEQEQYQEESNCIVENKEYETSETEKTSTTVNKKIGIKGKKEKNEDECVELKNIMYKTMLHKNKHTHSNHNLHETKATNNMINVEKFLEEDKQNKMNDPWSKLNKTSKTERLLEYAKVYQTEKQLSDEEYNDFLLFLKTCLETKKLARVKDVVYDKSTGVVKEIPALFYNKQTKHFTLKNTDKRVCTLKNLKVPLIKSEIKEINE